MKISEAMTALTKCARAEMLWKRAAKQWERDQDFDELSKARHGEAETIMRALSPRITCDYPGLYPSFKCDEKDEYSLSGAYSSTLTEKDRRVFLAARTLRDLLERGMVVALAHSGDRERCKLIISVVRERKARTVDITRHVANLFGYRYSDRRREVTCYDATGVVERLGAELFGDGHGIKGDWL